MKISACLALMVAAILIPVILFSTLSLNLLLRAERDGAVKGVRETARISQLSMDRELTNSESAVRMLANAPYFASGDLTGFYQQAQYADAAGTTWTALLDVNGEQLLNTSIPFGTPLPRAEAASGSGRCW